MSRKKVMVSQKKSLKSIHGRDLRIGCRVSRRSPTSGRPFPSATGPDQTELDYQPGCGDADGDQATERS